MELGKLKFELFYLSKVVLGSDRIKMLFNQLDFRRKPCYPVRGEKEDLTHRYQKKKNQSWGCRALEQTAQGSGRNSIPGIVQKKCGYGEHGLMMNILVVLL